MNEYLTSEVVVDYADGLISRREALRRLTMLGVSLAVAATMLAACASPGGSTPTPAGSGSGPAGPAPLPTEAVTFPGPRGILQGAWAAAADPRGSVLVIHENRGLTDHIRSVAGRLAASGYSALAVDLLSEEGGTATFTDPARATAALSAAAPTRFVPDLRAGLDELLRRVPAKSPAAMGFCFGGGMVWQLLAAGEPRLRAAVPFYGPLPDHADLSGSKPAAVLGIYAEDDARVNASRDAARAALEQAGLKHEIVTFPGVNHAFFNDTGQRYAPAAAAQAYQRVLDWFAANLS
ncbi:dienelactone hydrolase family protein [Dactylosporangium aurantiacum]|uniref:Dienelactone hydrolase family protein n=1 Tax=Dactylosporangium aurantiacum TaxID=35754 RepID=A0A9Q9IHL7_9ACTN|nr:dienelactone hydrolase family protein [Dactylosporangium aurantiacum]MDG6108848.1 dienelactone hydrolase family protein [Dactylosporangium aurantiacum]UWZ55746.1 dienelactone hydrolase family protein [Dactylosporangium aurantiacum]